MGGYGYWSGGGPGIGTWMMYDMMSDAVMMNAMMSNRGYHVGPAPVVHAGHGYNSGWGAFWSGLFGLITLIIVIIAIIVVVRLIMKNRRNRRAW